MTLLRSILCIVLLAGSLQLSAQDDCDLSWLKGSWEGMYDQYSHGFYAKYPAVLNVNGIDGCKFWGTVAYPTLGNGLTEMIGRLRGDTLYFTERKILRGEDFVLNGTYKVRVEDKAELKGIWMSPLGYEGARYEMFKPYEEEEEEEKLAIIKEKVEQPAVEEESAVQEEKVATSKPAPAAEPEPAPEPVTAEPATALEKDMQFAADNIPTVLKGRTVEKAHQVTYSELGVLEVAVWDNEIEDGDIVSLNFNGEWVLKDHPLTRKKKRFKLYFDKNAGNNYLILYANNLGRLEPNTAAIRFSDGVKEKTIILRSNRKNCEAINFKVGE